MASQKTFLIWWCGAVIILLMLLTDQVHAARDRTRAREKTKDRQPKNQAFQPEDDYVGESANISRLLDHIQKGYDKRLRPNFNGPPVDVDVTMHIVAVSSISEVDMDYTLDMYCRQTWTDKRLAFMGTEPDELSVSNEMLGKIWWPDTFFANSKHTKFHDVTTKNAFLRIKNTGEIYLSLRLTVTSMCNMDLSYFPMDSQTCTLEIESYGYSTKDISYKWKELDDPNDRPVTLESVQLPQFVVGGTITTTKVQELASGNYIRLVCKFLFVRSLGYYIIQIYVPSCLIVVLSWVSFWLSADAVPARVALGITTVLTMTTLISSTNSSLPKISYLKSIDVYLVTCFVMVFASLLEYAAVSYLSNRQKRKVAASKKRETDALIEKGPPHNLSPIMYRKGSMDRLERCDMMDPAHLTEVRVTSLRKLHTECDLRSNLPPGSVNANYPPTCRNSRTPEDISESCEHKVKDSCLNHPGVIDKYSRALFPLVFIVFNFMYWITYLNISNVEDFESFDQP